MPEEKIENPTIEAPTVEAPSAKPAGEINYAEIVAKLEKAGITEPKQLDGKLQAAQERGHLANLLGQRNQELADMKSMMADMQAALKKQNTRGAYDEDSDKGAGAIDLGDLIERRIESAFDKRQKASLEMQQRAFQAWQSIQNDEDYHLVAPDWESKLREPNFAVAVQSGTVDIVKEYQRMVRDHYKNAIRSAAQVIKDLTQGGLPPKVHVEDSARVSARREPEITEQGKTISTLRDGVNKGKVLTEDEELAALTAVLSGGRPPPPRR